MRIRKSFETTYFQRCVDCEFYDENEHACDYRAEYLDADVKGCTHVYTEYEELGPDPDFAYDNARQEACLP